MDDKTVVTNETDKTARIIRPPPLFVYGVGEIVPPVQQLQKIVGNRYVMKTLSDRKVKILLGNKDDYQNTTKMLKEKGT